MVGSTSRMAGKKLICIFGLNSSNKYDLSIECERKQEFLAEKGSSSFSSMRICDAQLWDGQVGNSMDTTGKRTLH